MKKTRQFFSVLLTLAMLLSLVPAMGVTASAAEPEWTIVNSFDELKAAMQQGTKTNIKLGKDINTNDEENHKYGLTTYDQILVGNTITLDLNGKKLTLNSRQNKVSSYINVTLGNLTVQDSVGGGEIFLNDEYEGGSTLILLMDTATFTLKSGTIRATTKPETSGIELIQSRGTVNIEGGTLTCTQTNGEIGRLRSDPNHWTSCYALKCFASDRVQTTITGGEFTGFVRIPVKNNGKQNKITNVTFDGSVVLDLADEKNMTWSKPGGRVIARKGATFYAVSISVCHICKCILTGIDTTMTVSTMMHGEYGISDVCLSTLNMVGSNGIVGKVNIPLTDEEVKKLRHSADTLKDVIKNLDI